jgi:hypothetical protein
MIALSHLVELELYYYASVYYNKASFSTNYPVNGDKTISAKAVAIKTKKKNKGNKKR